MKQLFIVILLFGLYLRAEDKEDNFWYKATRYVAEDFKESLQNCISSESKEALGFKAFNMFICAFLATDLAQGKSKQDFLIAGTAFFLGMCYIDFYKNKFFKEKNLFFKKIFHTGLFLLFKAAMPEINSSADLKRMFSTKDNFIGDSIWE